jgi:hypothetical protein
MTLLICIAFKVVVDWLPPRHLTCASSVRSLTCVQGYLTDTTQAALTGAPDAIAAATLHCIQGGSGLVTTAAPHMYELHSWPMQGSPYSAELHALSTFKPHVWTRQDEHTITTMQLICYSIAQWGSTTLSYAGENQRSWFATSLKTLNTSPVVSRHRSNPETGTYLAFQCSHATMRSVGRFTPEYLQGQLSTSGGK